MKAYSFDYNGIFIGEVNCELCQITELKKAEQASRLKKEGKLAEGEKLIESEPILPAYSTLKAPPSELEEGFQWKFINGDWYASEIPKPVEPEPQPEPEMTYQQKRAMEYPDMREYLDGVVKSHSQDQAVHEEGVAQIEKYIQDCLAVKAKYPKPIDEVGE